MCSEYLISSVGVGDAPSSSTSTGRYVEKDYNTFAGRCTSTTIFYSGVQGHMVAHRWSYLWHLVWLSKVLLMASTVG